MRRSRNGDLWYMIDSFQPWQEMWHVYKYSLTIPNWPVHWSPSPSTLLLPHKALPMCKGSVRPGKEVRNGGTERTDHDFHAVGR